MTQRYVVHYDPVKTLHIITGPPGSGKSTLAEKWGYPVYDRDLGNLEEWETDRSEDVTVTVTAPKIMQKQGWVERARSVGRVPRLYTIWVSRMTAHTRAEQRDVRNTDHTFNWIEYWYKHYRRHHLEVRV